MIYLCILGWVSATVGWWAAWNLFFNLRDYVKVSTIREQQLIQARIKLIDDLEAALAAATAAHAAQQKATNRTLN
jgi:hypothetical protein